MKRRLKSSKIQICWLNWHVLYTRVHSSRSRGIILMPKMEYSHTGCVIFTPSRRTRHSKYSKIPFYSTANKLISLIVHDAPDSEIPK